MMSLYIPKHDYILEDDYIPEHDAYTLMCIRLYIMSIYP